MSNLLKIKKKVIKKTTFNRGVHGKKNVQLNRYLGNIIFCNVSKEFLPAFVKFETCGKNKHFCLTLLKTSKVPDRISWNSTLSEASEYKYKGMRKYISKH